MSLSDYIPSIMGFGFASIFLSVAGFFILNDPDIYDWLLPISMSIIFGGFLFSVGVLSLLENHKITVQTKCDP